MASTQADALVRHEHRVLALMLVMLHVAIWWDFGGAISRSLTLAHLGLFLIWQPLLSYDQRLHWRGIAVFALITVAFVSALSWVLVAFWVLLLIGLVGGRVNVARRQRYAYLIALVFLVLELLIGCIPPMFALSTPTQDFLLVFRYGLFALPVVLFFIAGEQSTTSVRRAVDFFYGLTMSVLTLILGLGSLTSTLATGTEYPVALVQTLMAIGMFLLVIAWLWAPMAGFSGLGQLWERYVQNLGTPFELWLSELQQNARGADSPQRFLALAIDQLRALTWVAGVDWSSADGDGSSGALTEHVFRSRSDGLTIAIHAYRPMGTTLMLHARLLIQLIGHFYRAKQDEVEVTRQTHLHAIYETGARVTHDIKNLLQSLKSMTSAVQHAEGRDPRAGARLVQRQLPLITQRLQLALEKLQSPRLDRGELQRASAWWAELTERNADQGIAFAAALGADPLIPKELFDSVAENLIENGRFKRQREPGIRIRVRADALDDGLRLRVSDDGSRVPEAIRAQLFDAAVVSDTGLGIGLYQAARQAREHGYRLTLSQREGEVAFELGPAGAEADRDQEAGAGS